MKGWGDKRKIIFYSDRTIYTVLKTKATSDTLKQGDYHTKLQIKFLCTYVLL